MTGTATPTKGFLVCSIAQAFRRSLGALLGGAALVAGLMPASPAAAADSVVSPLNSNIVITGAGYGHGIGMSQWGAYGAADAGLSYSKILSFYYPSTTLGSVTDGATIRVWISADNDGRLHARPASGLRLTDSSGKRWTLPTGSKYTLWRVSRSGTSRVLHYRNASGTWVAYKSPLSAARAWTFDNPTSGYVTVLLPNGTSRDLRSQVSLRFYGSGARTVNILPMESYLLSVVPSEMPSSWPAEALKAQTVAARSYAARFRVKPQTGIYDLCDTTYCQVYKGLATRKGTTRTVNEFSSTNSAIGATKNRVLTYGGGIALTMFSSSNGGQTADGKTAYLVSKADPYDGRVRKQVWSVPLSSAKIASAYPSIGTFSGIRVSRDGDGPWGGRVTSVVVSGTKGSVTVSGGSFKSKFGLRERLFLPVAGLKPGTGNWDRWQALGGTPSFIGAPTTSERMVAGGLHAKFTGADVFWSSATGSKYLTGDLLQAYLAEGGPKSDLGFPKSDVIKTSTGVYANFQLGRISCRTGSECVVSFG